MSTRRELKLINAKEMAELENHRFGLPDEITALGGGHEQRGKSLGEGPMGCAPTEGSSWLQLNPVRKQH